MNLDDLARDAAAEVRQKAETLLVPVHMPSPRTRWLLPATVSAAAVLVATAAGLLIRDRQSPPVVTNVQPTTTTVASNPSTTSPPTTSTTIVEAGPRLGAPPSEPHIEVGLNDMTLILTVEGGLVGHIQPGMVGPEFYQDRQRRLTADVETQYGVPPDCLVDAVIEPDRSWWVMCDPEAESGPYISVLSAEGEVTVVGQLPDPPLGARAFGHWRDVFVREDGALLAQFSGECEIPHAMFIVDGVASHVSGEGFWGDAPVPNSYAFGWLPDGRALVWTEYETGCGSADPQPGLYAYDLDGTRELLLPFGAHPFWGRVVTLPPAGVAGLTWLRAQFGVGVSGSDGSLFIADPLRSFFIKTVAWDHGEGFVYLSEDGAVRWWRPDADTEVVRFDEPTNDLAIVDVSMFDRQVVVVERNGSLLAFDLITGAAADDAVQRYRRVETGEISFLAGGRTAAVVGDELIVTHQEGLLRVGLSGPERPFVVLHDFDGRRVIVSIEALEPADAPRTVYVIDLECSTCTEVIETFTADSFDLVGVLERAGPVVVPALLTGE